MDKCQMETDKKVMYPLNFRKLSAIIFAATRIHLTNIYRTKITGNDAR